IRLINFAAKAAAENGIPISICGDLAANLDFTEIFVGMGIKSLSVPSPMIGRLKKRLGEISNAEAEKTLQKVLSMENEDEIEDFLKGGI
ncbi:MAG: putative PEP-binding protein, partial [Clostridia bacterium]|nr:putative PEP-binding protein [Clostridia bacterium]